MKKSPLFSEFSSINKTAWKQQAIKDLKGKDFDTHLLWHTAEGMTVSPYFTAEDMTDERLPELRSVQKKTLGWLNKPVIVFENEKVTNNKVQAVLQKGADAITIDLTKVSTQKVDFIRLLHGLKLSDTPIFFQTNGRQKEALAALKNFIPYQMKGGFGDDELARWMMTGEQSEVGFDCMYDVLQQIKNDPQFRSLCVSSHPFHNAGANAAQELAFTLASAVTYIDKLTDLGLAAEDVIEKLYFSISVGNNYFMEMAKLRALRYLWAVVVEEYSVKTQCLIHTQTSTYYDAAISPHTNLIRATIQAMSAVMGGCDALTVNAYDISLRQSDDFSERIARNISTILKEEAHLDKTADAAAGSYFVENLTLQLVDAAWTLFLEVEQKGGLVPAFEQNFIQEAIELNHQKHRSDLQEGNRIMVGVTKYRAEADGSVPTKLVENDIYNTAFKLLTNRRIAAYFEVI